MQPDGGPGSAGANCHPSRYDANINPATPSTRIFMASSKATTAEPSHLPISRNALETHRAQSLASGSSGRSSAELLLELQVHRAELETQRESLLEAVGALEAARDHFAEFYELAPVGYLTIGDNGLIADINLTGAALLSMERGRIIRTQFSSFVLPADVDRYNAHFFEVLRMNGKRTCELVLLREDGSRIDVRLDSLRITTGGMAPALRTVLTDITERKQAEAALRESEERWRFAIDGAGDGLWDWNIETGAAYYSSRYKEMFGYADADFGTTSDEWSKRIRPDDAPSVFAAIRPHFEGKPGSAAVEFRMLCKDGSWKWTLGRGMVISRDADGKPLRMIGTNTDITERKQVQAELLAAKESAEAANLAKSRFLAAASHDLRQPIQAIRLFEEALNRVGLNLEQKRIHDSLSQSVQSLVVILDALLDVSKLDAGMVPLRCEPVEIDQLFRDVDTEFSPLAAAKSLRFKLYFPQGNIAIFTDIKLLQILLWNLIGNAFKYTETGGILVGLRRRGERVLVQVWDTGMGIAPESMGKIFDEYFQVDNPERDRIKGMGLGLAIVKRVAHLLETEVDCRSRPGVGSVFEFSLPLAEKSPPKMTPGTEGAHALADPLPVLVGRHIVVIDDHALVAEATKLALESHGLIVATYSDAESALANPEIAKADFYISDLSLPGMNGVQLLAAIQQRSKGPIKAVVLTGNTAPEQIELIQSSGWKVLYKPIDLPTLLSAVAGQGRR